MTTPVNDAYRIISHRYNNYDGICPYRGNIQTMVGFQLLADPRLVSNWFEVQLQNQYIQSLDNPQHLMPQTRQQKSQLKEKLKNLKSSTSGYCDLGGPNASDEVQLQRLHALGFRINLFEYIDISRNETKDGLFTMTNKEMKQCMDARMKLLTSKQDIKAYQVGVMAYLVLILNQKIYRTKFMDRLVARTYVEKKYLLLAISLIPTSDLVSHDKLMEQFINDSNHMIPRKCHRAKKVIEKFDTFQGPEITYNFSQWSQKLRLMVIPKYSDQPLIKTNSTITVGSEDIYSQIKIKVEEPSVNINKKLIEIREFENTLTPGIMAEINFQDQITSEVIAEPLITQSGKVADLNPGIKVPREEDNLGQHQQDKIALHNNVVDNLITDIEVLQERKQANLNLESEDLQLKLSHFDDQANSFMNERLSNHHSIISSQHQREVIMNIKQDGFNSDHTTSDTSKESGHRDASQELGEEEVKKSVKPKKRYVTKKQQQKFEEAQLRITRDDKLIRQRYKNQKVLQRLLKEWLVQNGIDTVGLSAHEILKAFYQPFDHAQRENRIIIPTKKIMPIIQDEMIDPQIQVKKVSKKRSKKNARLTTKVTVPNLRPSSLLRVIAFVHLRIQGLEENALNNGPVSDYDLDLDKLLITFKDSEREEDQTQTALQLIGNEGLSPSCIRALRNWIEILSGVTFTTFIHHTKDYHYVRRIKEKFHHADPIFRDLGRLKAYISMFNNFKGPANAETFKNITRHLKIVEEKWIEQERKQQDKELLDPGS